MRRAAFVICAFVFTGFCGCFDGDGAPSPRPGPGDQLPTGAYESVASICSSAQGSGFGPDDARRRQRQGERRIAALVRGYNQGPGRIVRVGYVTSDDGIQHEKITVARLIQRQLRLLEPTGGDPQAACLRKAHQRLEAGLSYRGSELQAWLAREDVRNYVKALAHGDERAACQRFAFRAAAPDLKLLVEAYTGAAALPGNTPEEQCMRRSQRVAKALTAPERRRLGELAVGETEVQGASGCVPAGRGGGFPVRRTSGGWMVSGLRPLRDHAPRARRSVGVSKRAYRGC